VTRARLVGLVLGAVALWLALRGVSLAALGQALGAMNPWALVPVTAVYVVEQLVRALRQLLLVRALNPAASYPGELAVLWIGMFCVNTFPARLGEAVRPVLWHQRDGIPLAGGAGVVVAERALDVLGLLVSLLVVALWARVPAAAIAVGGVHVDFGTIGRTAAAIMLPLALAVLVGAALFGERLVARLDGVAARVGGARVRRAVERAAGLVGSFAEGFRALRRPRIAGAVLALTALYFLAMGVMSLILARAFGLGAYIGLVEALGVLCVAMLGIALPAPPAFAGVFEASVRGGLALFGVVGGDLDGRALGFAVVMHGWLYLVHALGTVYFLWREGISLRGSLARVRGA
jgi:glycosyltransferase 2 family protein